MSSKKEEGRGKESEKGQKSRSKEERTTTTIGVALMETITPRYQTYLRQILTDRFDESELRTLCFDLDVDYDALSGGTKADKARELIGYLSRRDRVTELVEIGQRLRPDIPWKSPTAVPEPADLEAMVAQAKTQPPLPEPVSTEKPGPTPLCPYRGL